jgi:hypothetical protein
MMRQFKIQAMILLPRNRGKTWIKVYIWADNEEIAMKEARVKIPDALEWLKPEEV